MVASSSKLAIKTPMSLFMTRKVRRRRVGFPTFGTNISTLVLVVAITLGTTVDTNRFQSVNFIPIFIQLLVAAALAFAFFVIIFFVFICRLDFRLNLVARLRVF